MMNGVWMIDAFSLMLVQYNPKITVLKGPANFGLYWRELLFVEDNYDIFIIFTKHDTFFSNNFRVAKYI